MHGMIEFFSFLLADSIELPFRVSLWDHEKALERGRIAAHAIKSRGEILTEPSGDATFINDPRFPKPVCPRTEQRIARVVRNGVPYGPFIIDPYSKRIVGLHTRMKVFGLEIWGGPKELTAPVLIKNPLRRNERVLRYPFGAQNVTTIFEHRVYLGERTKRGAVAIRPAVEAYQESIRTDLELLPKRKFQLR